MFIMPGNSYKGAFLPLTDTEHDLKQHLQRDLEHLAGEIGERNFQYYDRLCEAVDFLSASFAANGYVVNKQDYVIDGQLFHNLEVELLGTDRPEEIIVIGAHYDSVIGCPGANDNGLGVVATLALARLLTGKQMARTVRFVAFVNEEPPFFMTSQMGSAVYAQRCYDRQEKIVAMLSLETIGYYSDDIGSQRYPIPLGAIYPLQGNFIGFIGNLRSGNLVRQALGTFRQHTLFPSEGTVLPGGIMGVGWSDHWSFWQQGYPAIMITDTAPFRYPYYHKPQDTPDKVCYDHLARVVTGLSRVIENLAGMSH